MKKSKLRVPVTPEFLRSSSALEAPRIGQYGWRPSQHDLAQLRQSTRDPVAYRTMVRAWRTTGFRVRAIRKFAGRPAPELTTAAPATESAVDPLGYWPKSRRPTAAARASPRRPNGGS